MIWHDIVCRSVGYSFLLLKYIKSGSRQKNYWEELARNLAAMHSADTSAFFDDATAEEIEEKLKEEALNKIEIDWSIVGHD